MGPYLGPEALENGITACVSSWQRFAPNTIPAGAKAGGNYLSGQLIAREARRLGFGEGIALASTGLLSEGAGENLFLVFDGALHTTPVSAALLNGITRDTLMTLAREHGIEVIERDLPREYLYLADEVFMCGTAAEVTPIRAVDGKQVGAGKAGPVTRRMQELVLRPVRRPHARTSGVGWKSCERSAAQSMKTPRELSCRSPAHRDHRSSASGNPAWPPRRVRARGAQRYAPAVEFAQPAHDRQAEAGTLHHRRLRHARRARTGVRHPRP